MIDYGFAEFGAQLLDGTADLLPWVAAGVSAAIVLMFAFMGIRIALAFFNELVENRGSASGGGSAFSMPGSYEYHDNSLFRQEAEDWANDGGWTPDMWSEFKDTHAAAYGAAKESGMSYEDGMKYADSHVEMAAFEKYGR